jgi:hypothetical protein
MMEDKTQYEALMEELKKIANNFRDVVTVLGDILAKILPDVEIPEEEEDTWEMKCPYKDGDRFYFVNNDGSVGSGSWSDLVFKTDCFNQGNVFPTKQEAELEIKRRNLLTRFRAFRDECNNGWKPDWRNHSDRKYYILYGENRILSQIYAGTVNDFPLFGYFKNESDCEKAIELFGDEIKELFVECD